VRSQRSLSFAVDSARFLGGVSIVGLAVALVSVVSHKLSYVICDNVPFVICVSLLITGKYVDLSHNLVRVATVPSDVTWLAAVVTLAVRAVTELLIVAWRSLAGVASTSTSLESLVAAFVKVV
jgi:hypothetical protein